MGGLGRGGWARGAGWVTRCKGRARRGPELAGELAPEAGASCEWAEGRARGQAGEARRHLCLEDSRAQTSSPGAAGGTGVPAIRERSRGNGRRSRPATASSGETPQAPQPPSSSGRRAPPPAPGAPARHRPRPRRPCARGGQQAPAPPSPSLQRAPGRAAPGEKVQRQGPRGTILWSPLSAEQGRPPAPRAPTPRVPKFRGDTPPRGGGDPAR